jgi:hypothetical protein
MSLTTNYYLDNKLFDCDRVTDNHGLVYTKKKHTTDVMLNTKKLSYTLKNSCVGSTQNFVFSIEHWTFVRH